MSEEAAGGLSPGADWFLRLAELDTSLTKRQKQRIHAYILAAAPNREEGYYDRCHDGLWLVCLMRSAMEDRAEWLRLRTRVVGEICSEEGPPEYFMKVPAVEPRRGMTPEEYRAEMEAVKREESGDGSEAGEGEEL